MVHIRLTERHYTGLRWEPNWTFQTSDQTRPTRCIIRNLEDFSVIMGLELWRPPCQRIFMRIRSAQSQQYLDQSRLMGVLEQYK